MNALLPAEVGFAPQVRRSLLVGPIACGCMLAGAAAYITAIDPNATGSHLPACPLHELTGLWCPACGLTRATHALLRGHIGAAIGFNILFPLFLGAIVVGWIAWIRSAAGRAPMRWLTRVPPWSGAVVAVMLLSFAVLRNLSAFSALAP